MIVHVPTLLTLMLFLCKDVREEKIDPFFFFSLQKSWKMYGLSLWELKIYDYSHTLGID